MKPKTHKTEGSAAVVLQRLVSPKETIQQIKQKQAAYAALFEATLWTEDMLSEIGWLGLIGMPWLLDKVENNGQQNCEDGNANRNPGAHSVGLAQSPIQFVLTEEPHANAALVVPASNKLAHFFCRLLPKLKGVVVFHGVIRANETELSHRWRRRGSLSLHPS